MALKHLDGMNLHPEDFRIMFKQRIDEFRLKRGDDILIATYPRTGTTWVSQIVSLMLAGEEKYEETKKIPLHDRVLFLEMTWRGNDYAQIEILDSVPPPRADKTHLMYKFVRRWIEEDKVKTILTTRNPKDTVVSHFHFYRQMKHKPYEGAWNEFFEDVVKAGKSINGSQYDWLFDWDKNKSKGEMLFLKYEDLKQDIVSGIKQIAEFLDIQLTDALIQRIVHDANVKQMKVDDAIMSEPNATPGNFVRSGQTGEWKKYFTVEQNEWFDNKYKKLFEELDIDVDYN